jgi:type I restriction enzyme S subunit
MELVAEKYKRTDVGIIPNDWVVKTIGSFTDVCAGGTPSTSVKEFWNGDIRWMNSGELNLKRVFEVENRITELGLNNSATRLIPVNCILIGLAGQGKTRGTVAINKVELCTNQSIAAIFPCDEVDYNFLFFNLDSRYTELRGLSTGDGGRGGLNLSIIKKLAIPLPPTKHEQTAIATVLSDMDALIGNLEKLIEKKRMIKQGAMQELLKPKEGWNVKKLPELVWFQEGPGVRNSQFTNSGVKLLNGTNIEDGKLLLEKTDRYISEKEANGWYSHFLVDEGDILIACSGVSIDKFDKKVTIANLSNLPLCMNTSTMRFKIKSNLLSKAFFFHFLKSKSFKDQIGGKATGSAQLNFGPSHVKLVEIHYPNFYEQERISHIITDMDTEIDAMEGKLEKCRIIKIGMMQNLLTGKIRLI